MQYKNDQNLNYVLLLCKRAVIVKDAAGAYSLLSGVGKFAVLYTARRIDGRLRVG